MVNPAFVCVGLPPPLPLSALYTAVGSALVYVGDYWGAVFLWPALLYALVTFAYIYNGTFGARLLCKRRYDGSMPLVSIVVFLPYLLCTWAVWWLRHALVHVSEDGYNLVAPGIYLGRFPVWFPCRRKGSSGAFPSEKVAVVDLTAEFPALPRVVAQAQGKYFCLPCLDGDMPEDKRELLGVAVEVAEWGPARPVYIHCANGRGRSCCFAILVMLLREGGPTTIDEAFASIKVFRPQVKTQTAQRQLLADVMKMHQAGHVELSATRCLVGNPAERAEE